MSIKNIVTGQLASITEYTAAGQVTDILTTGNVTAATLSAGTGNLQITGNTISSTASTITIDPLGDGTPAGSMIVAGNLQVTGTLTYNDIVNATTNDLQWIAANNATSESLATGAGLSVGPSGSYAQFTYNSVANSWQSSLPVDVSGNVTAPYFIGNGSQLTGLPAGYTNANVDTYLASNANVVINTTGNVTTTANVAANYFIGNGSQLTGLPPTYANSNVADYLASNANVAITTTGNITTTANITADYFIGNGSQLTGLFTTQAAFAKYRRTTAQTGIVDGSVVVCNVLESTAGTDIQVNTTTGSITLQPGRTYRLRGSPGSAVRSVVNPGTSTIIEYQWFNVTGNALLGTKAYITSANSDNPTSFYGGTAEMVFTPSVVTVVQFRITNGFQINSIGSSDSVFPWIDIEVIGGAIPSTNPIYSNANVAAYLPTYTGDLSADNISTTGNIIMNGGKISGFSATTPARLQHYAETVVAGGNLTGTLLINTTLGTLQRYTLTGNITINGFVNAVAGTNTTLILRQDATGSRTLTSTMKFLNGAKILSAAPNAVDVLSVFYDGVDYLATLGKGYV